MADASHWATRLDGVDHDLLQPHLHAYTLCSQQIWLLNKSIEEMYTAGQLNYT